MYFNGSYHTNWNNNLHMRNTSAESRSFNIKFYDENGSKIFDLPPTKINPNGLHIIELKEFRQLKNQKGLFTIWADSGIRGEQYVRARGGGPLRAVKTLDEGLPPFNSKGLSIFISYAMRNENADLYDLISRFVKAIGFTVLSAKESGRLELPPGTQISDMISESHAIIAVLTKDTETERDNKIIYQPSLNVIDEIGQGSNLPTIILVEEGAEVPSNIQTRSTYITFSRKNLSEMLIILMENMKSSGLT